MTPSERKTSNPDAEQERQQPDMLTIKRPAQSLETAEHLERWRAIGHKQLNVACASPPYLCDDRVDRVIGQNWHQG